MYYVYVIQGKCKNKIYIGSTNDLVKRLNEHNNRKVFSTKKYAPWKIMYYEAYRKEKFARMREKRLKQHGRAKQELKKRIGFYSGKSGAGYTLIEVMVSLAIFSLLAGYVILTIKGVSEQSRVEQETLKVTSVLREARNSAFNGIVEITSAHYPAGGYGVYFDRSANPDQYIFFADNNGDGLYAVDDPESERIRVYELSSNMVFNLADDLSINKMSIIFDGQKDPVFVDNCQAPCSPTAIASKVVKVKLETGTGCIGNIEFPNDSGPLFIEENTTGC